MLIAMACHDTPENNRSWMTAETLRSLAKTVDWDVHRLFVCDNASCDETRQILDHAILKDFPLRVLRNETNVGTANAINEAWRHRHPGEHCVKMDNDVTIYQAGWVDYMEDVFDRDPTIGILGLKRKDLEEAPWREGQFASTLRMLPHEKGQRWITVEEVEHVMGTVQGFSSALLDEIGYLVQPGLYGFDDSLVCIRAKVAGFKRAFLCGVEIEHLDPGGDAYCRWKVEQARDDFPAYERLKALYLMGAKPVYEGYDG